MPASLLKSLLAAVLAKARTLAVILTLSILPSVAQAVPLLQIDFGSGCLGATTSSSTGPIALSQDCSFDFFGTHTARASSTANFGALGTDLNLTLHPDFFFTPSNSAFITARSSGDYVFSGPGTTVTASLNLDVDGRLESACAPFRTCSISARVLGPGIDVTFLREDAGILVISEGITGSPQIYSTNASNQIDLFLLVSGDLSSPGDGIPGEVDASFLDTLTFNRDGPVFDLPVGFTVNGPCVENNTFVCGAAVPRAVPEPSGLALLAVGILGLLVAARRRAPLLEQRGFVFRWGVSALRAFQSQVK